MRNIHPGELLKEEVILANNLSITEAESLLGVTRSALFNIVNEKAAISPEMAIRIAAVFGGTPDIWVRLQAKYDLLAAK